MAVDAVIAPEDRQRLIGVVLAGGHGRRMGSADKPLLMAAGVPLFLRVVAALGRNVRSVVIAAGAELGRYQESGLTVLPDPVAGTGQEGYRAGPLAGILAGLDYAAAHGADWVVTCPADVPLIPPDLVARLLAALRREQVPAVCARSGDRWHPATAVLSVALAGPLRQALLAGERRVCQWLQGQGMVSVAWPLLPVDPFLNVNTPDDLARVDRLLREGLT